VPVIATPAGGVVEQVRDGEAGLVAGSISAEALAEAMRRFIVDGDLRRHLRLGVASAREPVSMERLLEQLLSVRPSL
jgi:glycosyltransferase involved in cell wall biosynthesis